MCPACIVNTAAIIVSAGSSGGILAACIGKLKKIFRAKLPALHPKN
jgi:fatty acid/phospholipid biosynthesis enzyme